EELDPVAVADSDLAVIFYTAGTTGKPKGAMLSCGALMFGVRTYAKIRAVMPFAPRDLSLLVMPLAHTSGHQALLLNLAIASPAYLMGRFDPGTVLSASRSPGSPSRYGTTRCGPSPTARSASWWCARRAS